MTLASGKQTLGTAMTQLYDEIGSGYQNYRRPDPRLATVIIRALDEAETVVNVGAGIGSYEPIGTVVAVEPSLAMIRQRQPGSPPVVQASAIHLPFRDAVFAIRLGEILRPSGRHAVRFHARIAPKRPGWHALDRAFCCVPADEHEAL